MCDSGVSVAPIGTPSIPMVGWESLTEINYREYVGTSYCKYSYEKVTNLYWVDSYKLIAQEQCIHIWPRELGVLHVMVHFVLLQGGYLQSSGRMDHVEVNLHHPEFCHVRCTMIPSMKPGSYRVYILLQKVGNFGSVSSATCDCAARSVYSKHAYLYLNMHII